MAALSILGTNLLTDAMVPLTNSTGGTSVSDPGAGGGSSTPTEADVTNRPITTADRVGAGILTLLALVGVIGGAWWINIE
jgi:mannan endo-1,6-alpha-mannosidase